MDTFETRNVVLDPLSIKIIEDFQQEKQLGQRGFSAALRQIVLEYPSLKVGAKVARIQQDQLRQDVHPSE